MPLPITNAIGVPVPPASRRVLWRMLLEGETVVTCMYTCHATMLCAGSISLAWPLYMRVTL